MNSNSPVSAAAGGGAQPGTPEEIAHFVVNAAVSVPSVHNTHLWRFGHRAPSFASPDSRNCCCGWDRPGSGRSACGVRSTRS
jgi:hypothetical protein